MKLFILTTVIAISTAAQLPSRNYIPQNQGGQGQGGFQGSQGSGGFGGSSSSSNSGGYSGGFGGNSGFGGGGNGNTRPQQQQEKNSAILKQEQEIDDSGSYHFGYETENGIRAEEAGNSGNAQGGFSYKGDDGHTYTITYTSGVEGFRPQGEHLPIPPPTPEAILEALQQNAKDEAAGIFDDGKYNPAVHSGPGGNGNQPGYSGRPGSSGFSGNAGFSGSGNHQTGFSASNGYTY